VDRNLHIERWLLSLKSQASAAGVEARVRALDFKGGSFLAFEVTHDGEVLEIRYRKGWAHTTRVVAATGPALAVTVRQVHEQLLQQHVRLLENGFRRFLRRSIDLLKALEAAFGPESDLPRRYEAALREMGGLSGARMAAVVRKRPGMLVKFEVLPAVALSEGGTVHFAGLSHGRLVDLSDLIKPDSAAKQAPRPAGTETGFRTVVMPADVPVKPQGVELVAPNRSNGIAAAVTADALVEGAAEIVEAGACLFSDAACPGDCGIDASAIDCGSVDCGGVDCSF
jgi:hypothetical protein